MYRKSCMTQNKMMKVVGLPYVQHFSRLQCLLLSKQCVVSKLDSHSSGKRVMIKKIRPYNETFCAGLAMAIVNTYVATGYEF
jgi:hypothetical protein